MNLIVENKPQKVQELSAHWRRTGQVGVVPTMGYLHEGHLSLVRFAKKNALKTIVTLFVNPLQFGAHEDLDQYPRAFESDLQKLEAEGVDLLFCPTVEDLYPPGFSTRVRVEGLTQHLCGQSRPGHFEGVTTVVLKLFQSCLPNFAVFGEKDFQQLRVIQQMVADLNMGVEVFGLPTVREQDGLAMSSRNRNLTEEEREWARRIPESLKLARQFFLDNPMNSVRELLHYVKAHLLSVPLKLDYLEVADETHLVPAEENTPLVALNAPRLFVAVKTPTTRLIDNVRLGA